MVLIMTLLYLLVGLIDRYIRNLDGFLLSKVFADYVNRFIMFNFVGS